MINGQSSRQGLPDERLKPSTKHGGIQYRRFLILWMILEKNLSLHHQNARQACRSAGEHLRIVRPIWAHLDEFLRHDRQCVVAKVGLTIQGNISGLWGSPERAACVFCLRFSSHRPR